MRLIMDYPRLVADMDVSGSALLSNGARLKHNYSGLSSVSRMRALKHSQSLPLFPPHPHYHPFVLFLCLFLTPFNFSSLLLFLFLLLFPSQLFNHLSPCHFLFIFSYSSSSSAFNSFSSSSSAYFTSSASFSFYLITSLSPMVIPLPVVVGRQ